MSDLKRRNVQEIIDWHLLRATYEGKVSTDRGEFHRFAADALAAQAKEIEALRAEVERLRGAIELLSTNAAKGE